VRGETVADAEEALDPEGGARRQSSKMCVKMTNAERPKLRPEPGGLMEPQKICLPAPGGNFLRNMPRQLFFAQSAIDLPDERLVIRQIMDLSDNRRVPILRRFLGAMAHRKNRRR